MAATDHTRLCTAQPSADSKSTDISRNLPPGMEAPSGAVAACNPESIPSEVLLGSTDVESFDGPPSISAELVREVSADISIVRALTRRHVGRVCDYLELGSSLAAVASRTASASMCADDQALAGNLADLADLITEEIGYLRQAAGIDRAPSTAPSGTLELPLGLAGTTSQRAPVAATPPESPN